MAPLVPPRGNDFSPSLVLSPTCFSIRLARKIVSPGENFFIACSLEINYFSS
jgi:hypothetical protein